MNTTTSMVLTAAVVVAGQWAQDKTISARFVVGVSVVALSLAALGEVNASLAQQFGLLLLVGAILFYGVPLAKALGLTK